MTTPTTKPYTRSNLPLIAGSERTWADNEFKKLEQTIKSLVEVITALETRLKALETKD